MLVAPQLLMERINFLAGKRATREHKRLNEALDSMAKTLGVDVSASNNPPLHQMRTIS